MTVSAAYGRVYKSQKDIKADWNSNKAFIIRDFHNRYCGKPVNKSQIPHESVYVLYKNDTKVFQVQ